ncbi:MAG: DNA polymerase IV [Cellulosilyticaceae bacterium]
MRKIIHIDMDAFFAAIEERDNPALKNKPIVVGGTPSGRGVVATCSYEARKYGIHSAMSASAAYGLCPKAVFIEVNHKKYEKVSAQIREIFKRYTDLIEPLSLDEAYLDVTENKMNEPDTMKLAKNIKEMIEKELQLTASAGVSYNKFLAKIASDYNKPNGEMEITEDIAQDFLDKLPIEKFFGVGKVTARDLKRIGIHKGKDLRGLEHSFLIMMFGKRGQMLYDFARGIDNRKVENHRERKSIGKESTFKTDQWLNGTEVNKEIREMAAEVSKRLKENGKKGRTITVKVKFDDFTQITRSITGDNTLQEADDILKTTQLIIEKINSEQAVRLVGVTVSQLIDETEEVFVNLNLFDIIK